MAGKRRGRGRQAPRRGYYWDGLQFPITNISSAGTIFELVGPTAQEFMPGTIVRSRGHLTLKNAGTDATNGGVEAALKMMYLEVNDAGTVTGDHQAIDTNEEDIARRQLWTYHTVMAQREGATVQPDTVRLEVDVRVKIKLEASGKMILALLADAAAGNRAQLSGYLRTLIMHA